MKCHVLVEKQLLQPAFTFPREIVSNSFIFSFPLKSRNNSFLWHVIHDPTFLMQISFNVKSQIFQFSFLFIRLMFILSCLIYLSYFCFFLNQISFFLSFFFLSFFLSFFLPLPLQFSAMIFFFPLRFFPTIFSFRLSVFVELFAFLFFSFEHIFIFKILVFFLFHRLSVKIKHNFFQAVVVSILLFGCTTWTLTKRIEKKLDGCCTRMLRAVLDKSWKQHPTKQQLYGHQSPISQTIQVRRTRHAGLNWRSKDELISDVLLWTPSHGRTSVGWPACTYLQHFCADTACSLEDLLKRWTIETYFSFWYQSKASWENGNKVSSIILGPRIWLFFSCST